MMTNFKFFDTEAELTELTGLDSQGLWDNDFCLDDWDWGFESDTCYVIKEKDEWDYTRDVIDWAIPQYADMLLRAMEDYCCGFRHTEYKGKHYYLIYHA